MVTTTDFDKFRNDLTLFHEGFSKPLAKHEIVDSELYAANQAKQTQFTEKALLTAGTCVYSHGQDSVEIIHKGDTRPLLFARDDAVKMSKIRSAGGQKKREREAEAKKRTGDSFFEAGKFEAALVTYGEALRYLDSASVELSLKLRLAASDAALKGGDAQRAEAEADFAHSLAPDADAPRFRRAIARLAQGKWQLAEDDLVACKQTPTVSAVRNKLLTKAAKLGVHLSGNQDAPAGLLEQKNGCTQHAPPGA